MGEASRLVQMTDQLLSEILDSLADMSKDTLNMDLDIPEVNSLYVLARHVLGSVEEWGLYLGLGTKSNAIEILSSWHRVKSMS